jgi:hypothetical protein
MKTVLPFLMSLFVVPILNAQTVSTPTITPVNPTSADTLRIYTSVYTPSQSKRLSKTLNINHSQKVISIEMCLFDGMLPATKTFLDTFKLAPIGVGSWSVIVTSTMSSSDQTCQSYTSSSASNTVNVSLATDIKQTNSQPVLKIYPNPAYETITVDFKGLSGHISLLDVLGGKFELAVEDHNKLDVRNLPPGVYLLYVHTKTGVYTARFIRTD